MLTYELKKLPGLPLYEALYRCIREDICAGRLPANEKLPSKRALAQHLEVSKITVEGAYEQLLSEGYIRSREKVGYFVEPIRESTKIDGFAPTSKKDDSTKIDGFAPTSQKGDSTKIDEIVPPSVSVDLTANGPIRFPFSVWSRLQRQVMLDLGEQLLTPLPNQGLWELRCAISDHLFQFRGLRAAPEHILIGAGTDFLYNLLIQLLGRDKHYAVEEPGYGKIRRIYAAGGVCCTGAPMDSQGVIPQALGQAQVLHISPSHHFPTGTVTSALRRQALIGWVNQEKDRWIIEDDYDSEFRFHARPMAALQSMDPDRVIYMNTFSKTLASPIRISYMVLPGALMDRFQRELGFYSCTVPSFEQYTLERFLSEGHFEKHINRMRKFYKTRRNRLLNAVQSSPMAQRVTVLEQNAGLHFLLKVDTELSDEALLDKLAAIGIRVNALGSYYHDGPPRGDTHTLVVNYSGLTDETINRLEYLLQTMK